MAATELLGTINILRGLDIDDLDLGNLQVSPSVVGVMV
jgi:hypothetical protein